MMILLTAKERNKVYKEWLAKSIPGEALDFNALYEVQGKAQLKKMIEWLNIEIIKIPVSKMKDTNEDYNLLADGINKIMVALLKEVE